MFTGLIERKGRVVAVGPVDFGAVLEIDPGAPALQAAAGDSIAVNGCCLTVAPADRGGRILRFDVIRQTLEVTTLGSFREGLEVNLERSATPSTLLGGHIVQGHIDGVGTVLAVVRDASQWRVRIATPEALGPLVVDRGSIAVDGVSLTVAAIEPVARPTWFEVALIPTTLALTTLAGLAAGDRVNLESDIAMRGVAHMLKWQRG